MPKNQCLNSMEIIANVNQPLTLTVVVFEKGKKSTYPKPSKQEVYQDRGKWQTITSAYPSGIDTGASIT